MSWTTFECAPRGNVSLRVILAVLAVPIVGCSSGGSVRPVVAGTQSEPTSVPTPMPGREVSTTEQSRQSRDSYEILRRDPTFETFMSLINASGLGVTLKGPGPMTVLAPTREAFLQMPDGSIDALKENKRQLREFLTRHILPTKVLLHSGTVPGAVKSVGPADISFRQEGDQVWANDAPVVGLGQESTNGVIYRLQRPLDAMAASRVDHPDNVLDVTWKNGSMKLFCRALAETGFMDRLLNDRQITVFAPSDAAFERLPRTLVEQIFSDRDRLTELIGYHIVSGIVSRSTLAERDHLDTFLGQALVVRRGTDRNDVAINGTARVEQSDIRASNGLLQIIDHVLIPAPTPPKKAESPMMTVGLKRKATPPSTKPTRQRRYR